MDACPGLRLVNGYGPTENTTFTTTHTIARAEADGLSLPIGRPVAGYTVRILDDRLRRAPVGAVGEICIGGFGVARGYLGMAEETAAAFVADPFAPGQRLYRSGDRAQWRDDGAILFRGRRDDQVKIRGQRIELGAVEAHGRSTSACPGWPRARSTAPNWPAPFPPAPRRHRPPPPRGDSASPCNAPSARSGRSCWGGTGSIRTPPCSKSASIP
jgi:hypothetical protein